MDAPITRSKVPLFGLILLIFVSVAGAVAIGAITAAIERYLHFYLILVFALIEGLLAGGVVVLAMRVGKVRSKFVAVIFGILAGLITYGTYWYGDYYLFKQQVANDRSGSSRQQSDELVDTIFKTETGQPGVVGFLMYQAKEGFGITSSSYAGSSARTTDLTLQGTTAYGYYAVELLAICLIAAAAAFRAAGTPFCERDNRFFTTKLVGRIPKDSADQFMTMARVGDWRGASMLLEKSKSKMRYPYLEIQAQRCPACNTNPVPVSVTRKQGSRKSAQKVVFKTTLTPEQYGDFAGIPLETIPAMA